MLPLAAGVVFIAHNRAPVAVAASTPRLVHTAMQTSTGTNCTITPADLDAITAAASDGLLAELSVRKALLVRTITCAKTDTTLLQNNLNSIKTADTAKTIQSQLSGKLDDAINYYNLELGRVNGAGIAGTQSVAHDVLAWRSGTYNPLAAQVSNFIVWTNNQPLFDTAANRLSSVESVVGFIEQAAPQNDLQSDFANAQSLVETANNENRGVADAFLRSLPPDQTLGLIQQSLASLSDVYQKFFDISAIVQTLLPTKN